ncbi:hypothetical protein J7L68_10005 [bacterium]|nr:hypothetical protein [bacterium]
MKTNIILVLITCLIIPSILTAIDNSLVVTGISSYKGTDKNIAYAEAVKDAKKKAVEEGLRLFLESTSATNQFDKVKMTILGNYDDYVINADLLKKELMDDGKYYVKMEIIVDLTKIELTVKRSTDDIKQAMGNPTITFVLTTWEIKGEKKNVIVDDNQDFTGNANYTGSASKTERIEADYDYSGNANVDIEIDTSKGLKGSAEANVSESASGGYSTEANTKVSDSLDISSDYHRDLEVTVIDEELWKKVPDLSIIDAFQQEFIEKGFELRASDRAREVAMSESIISTSINPLDRKAVRDQAEKDGVNFVARGEAMVLDIRQTGLSIGVKDSIGTSSKRPIFSRKRTDVGTENIEVDYSEEYIATVKVGVEIIDVNSGDVVASYSNTETALNSNPSLAKSQGIKKCAVLAARTLASQTLTTWQNRVVSGSRYSIEIHGIYSIRSQQRPIIQAIEEVGAEMQSITTPEQGKLLIQCIYKGTKTDLGYGLLDNLGVKPGFEEGKFDGPFFEGGLIIFKFLN